MKLIITAFLLTTLVGIACAQQGVPEKYPRSKIYVTDQNGQQVEMNDNLAVQFKDAVIDLVRKDPQAISINSQLPPAAGPRLYTVTQMPVESNVNGYQISFDETTADPNHPQNIYAFSFHVDETALYFYDPNGQQWVREQIGQDNTFNLRRSADYAGQFNAELANGGQQAQAGPQVDLTAPVDADVTANEAPPAMPDYQQPACPVDGYLWQPGYWAYSPYQAGYYWVPGAWVGPPSPGLLWTPGYWGYSGAIFVFHSGYWGAQVGFYGGVNYGYGYVGHGYYGGQWQGGHFAYNTAVANVNTTVVHNTYVNNTVINNTVVNNHASYNGQGGVTATPNSQEVAAANQQHFKPTAEQNSHQLQARSNPTQFAKFNGGNSKPVLASAKPMTFQPQNNTNSPKPAGWKTQPPPVKQPASGKPGNPGNGLGHPANPSNNPSNKPQGNNTQPANGKQNGQVGQQNNKNNPNNKTKYKPKPQQQQPQPLKQ